MYNKYLQEYERMRVMNAPEHDCFSADYARPLYRVFTDAEIDVILKACIFDEGEDVWACRVCKELVEPPDMLEWYEWQIKTSKHNHND